MKHGQVVVIECHGCPKRTAVYANAKPRGWLRLKGCWFCPACVKRAKGT